MSRRGDNLRDAAGPWVSDGCVGMACGMFHVPTLDKVGGGWSIRRAHHLYGTPRTHSSVGWPDNETMMSFALKAAGTPVRFLGRETNFENQETEHWLHARSMTLSLMSNGRLDPRHGEAFARMQAVFESWS